MMEAIRFALCVLCIAGGLVSLLVGLFGTYRFSFVLNRMHCASIGDTLGLALVCLGLVFAFGMTWASAKLILIVVLMWTTSPVAGHLLAKLVCTTEEDLSPFMTDKTHTQEGQDADL